MNGRPHRNTASDAIAPPLKRAKRAGREMGTRSLIAKMERDGRGRHIDVSHDGSPTTVGRILLEHYQDSEKLDRLLDHGNAEYINSNPERVRGYHEANGKDWQEHRPIKFEGGTTELFSTAHTFGPEWLYCWTPDGWAAAKLRRAEMPHSFIHRLATMPAEEFQDWLDHNREPECTRWGSRCQQEQIARPLSEIIDEYERSQAEEEEK